LSRRESRIGTYACVFLLLLGFQIGVARYQAKEVAGFILDAHKRDDASAWTAYLTSTQKMERGRRTLLAAVQERREKRLARTIGYPPPSRDVTTRTTTQTSVATNAPVLLTPVGKTDVSWHLASPVLPSPESQLASTLLPEVGNETGFPAFERAVYPVSQVPDWGAMRTPEEWDRTFQQMTKQDMVPLPRYDISQLTVPMQSLTNPITAKTIPLITAKLVYSTHYYGAYDLDAGEFTGLHPGIDIKLALGTSVGCLAGGRVQTVAKDKNMGLYVIVEHRLPSGETLFSIYGHFDTVWVQEGDAVRPGQALGIVGMTGATTGPHVHLQVDRDDGVRPHQRYWPASLPGRAEADKRTINPIDFIGKYANSAE
jgi:hypothetical protein